MVGLDRKALMLAWFLGFLYRHADYLLYAALAVAFLTGVAIGAALD